MAYTEISNSAQSWHTTELIYVMSLTTTYMQFIAVKCLFYYVVDDTYNYHSGIICDIMYWDTRIAYMHICVSLSRLMSG